MPTKRFIVSVDAGQEGGEFTGIVSRLRRAGFEVSHTLDTLGLVRGSADPEKLDLFRAIPGVTAIEEEREIGPAAS
jgi:hypothetical protein